jgi:hypothetical protein
MPKRSSKKDVNQIAASIVQAAVGTPDDLSPQGTKNPAAVGREGEGGQAI